MGERPAGKTLDRFPDNDGNYEPDNCRWATKVEQANNRRGNRVISIDGERKTVAQWASASGIPERTLLNRASKGGDEFTAEILDASFRSPKKQFVEHGGSRYSIADLCAITGLSAFGVTDRVRRFNDGQLDFLGLTTRPAKKKAPTRQVATSVV